MSAYMVDTGHIDALINAGLGLGQPGSNLRWFTRPVRSDEGMDVYREVVRELTPETAGRVGAMLLTENRRSVDYRYDEEELEEVYEFHHYVGHFDPVAVLKAIDCYEYQACEHPDWPESEAHSFCDSLRKRAIHALPGYDNAPWGVTDVAQVTKVPPMRVSSPRRRNH